MKLCSFLECQIPFKEINIVQLIPILKLSQRLISAAQKKDEKLGRMLDLKAYQELLTELETQVMLLAQNPDSTLSELNLEEMFKIYIQFSQPSLMFFDKIPASSVEEIRQGVYKAGASSLCLFPFSLLMSILGTTQPQNYPINPLINRSCFVITTLAFDESFNASKIADKDAFELSFQINKDVKKELSHQINYCRKSSLYFQVDFERVFSDVKLARVEKIDLTAARQTFNHALSEQEKLFNSLCKTFVESTRAPSTEQKWVTYSAIDPSTKNLPSKRV